MNGQAGITIRVDAQTAQAAQKLQQFFSDTTNNVQRLVGSITALVGVGGLGYLFTRSIKEGLAFNAALQDATLGIAAIQKQFNPEKFKNFDDAIRSASSAVDLLREKAVRSPASFQQLVQAFQGLTGAATSAGISMRNQVDLVVLMSQALAGLGIRSEQILQESRALLTGNINADAAAARILGITKQDIDQAREAGQLYEFLTGKLQAFAEAGERGARNFTTAMSNLRDVIEQKLARATETLFTLFTEGFLALTQFLDSSDIAARIDGFVALVVDFWKRGRIDELIGLTIQAGFEQGQAGLIWLWEQLKAAFSSNTAKRLGVTFSISFTKALAEGFVDVFAALVKLGAQSVASLVDLIVAQVDAVMRKIESIPIFKKLFGQTEWSKSGMAGFNINEGVAEYIALVEQGAAVAKAGIGSFFDQGMTAASDLWGGNFTGSPMNASARLAELVNQQIQLRDAAKAGAQTQVEVGNAAVARRVNIEKELEFAEKLSEQQRRLIESDWRLTDSQKFRMLQQGGFNPDGADPNSLFESLASNSVQMLNQIGTMAQNAASIVTNTLGAAFAGIGDRVANIVLVTGDWKEGLLDLARTVVGTLLSSFVQFFVNILARSILNAILGTSLQAAAAAASAAVWAGPAILASTATFGAAAAQAPASVASALATAPAIAALGSAAGFAEGGFTGVGGKYDVAGVVHKGEFVLPADSVQQYGLPLLEAMRQGEPAAAGAGAGQVTIAVLYDPSGLKRFLESNAGKNIIVKHVGDSRSDLGLQT